MNLKSKITLITLATIIALVGVGYASWTFTSQVASTPIEATGLATASIEAQGLTVEDGAGNTVSALYLICDAPAGQDGLVAGEGIYWATDAAGTNRITALTLKGSVNQDDNDIADFTTYIGTFGITAVAAINGPYVGIPAVAAASHDSDATSKNADAVYVFTLPVPSYNAVPTNVSEVNALQAEVNAIDIEFSFTFSVKSVA